MVPAAALLQPSQPLADLRVSDNAGAAVSREAPARVDVVALSTTPTPDEPAGGSPTGNGQAALRLIDSQQTRAPHAPVDPPQAPLPAGAAPASPPQPIAVPPGESLAPGGDTGDKQLGALLRDGAPHMAAAAAQSREAAPSRPAAANRDEHDDAPDRTLPAGPGPAPMQPPAAGGDLVRAGAATAQLAPPVGSEAWGAALSQQIARLGKGGEVELNLNPAELGPLKVKVSLGGGQAEVTFLSDHLAVRQAIEASIPQLRSSLADSGISLGQATVGSGSGDAPSPQRQHQPPPQQPRTFRADPPPDETGRPVAARRRGAASAVDTFA